MQTSSSEEQAALTAADAAQQRAMEASAALEESLPGLDRQLEQTLEALEQAQAAVQLANQREQEASSAFMSAEAEVPRADRALKEAQHNRDELVSEGEHLATVVDLLQNSLKALNNLRPRGAMMPGLSSEGDV